VVELTAEKPGADGVSHRALYPNTVEFREQLRRYMDVRGLANAGALANASRGALSRQVADRVLNGDTSAMRRNTLDAIAVAVGVPVSDLIALTGHVTSRRWTWPPEFDHVPDAARGPIQRAVKAMLRATGAWPDQTDPPA
jgi:hypothetical protein